MPSLHLPHYRHVMTISPLLFFFLPLLPPLITAQHNLTIGHPLMQPVDINLSENTTIHFQLTGPGFLLIEYVPDEAALRDTRPDYGLPNLLLSLSTLPDDLPYILSGTAKQADPERKSDYDCNTTFPCFKQSPIVDAESFYTRATRASIPLPLQPADQSLQYFATLVNYDRGFSTDAARTLPRIQGHLRINFYSNPICAGYAGQVHEQCLGRGNCTDNGCQCDSTFGGRVCEAKVFRKKGEEPNIPNPPANWSDDENSLRIAVEPFQTIYYVWSETNSRHRGVRLFAKVQNGTKQDVTVMVRGHKTNPASNVLDTPPPLPTALDSGDSCQVLENDEQADFACSIELPDGNENDDERKVSFAILANSTGGGDNGRRIVGLQIRTCGGPSSNAPSCTAGVFPWIVVPLALVIVSITGLATLIMLWLDRRHGFTDPVDRLTEKELNRMYPTRKFGERSLGQQAGEECMICLSPIERGELVRQLECEHIFHSECLDPWLTENNASCPTCRADVRLEHLSDKRYLRKIVTIFLWPIALTRRMRERQMTRRDDAASSAGQDASQDIETGLQPGTANSMTGSEGATGQTAAEGLLSNQSVTSGMPDITTGDEVRSRLESNFTKAGPQDEEQVVIAKPTLGLGSEG